MKKLLILIFAITVILVTACSKNESDSEPNSTEIEAKKEAEVLTEEKLLAGKDIYFGNLHSHTIYSWGEEVEGTPADHFERAKKEGLDFYAITDHDFWLILSPKLGITYWDATKKDVDEANEDGSFVAIRGYEWSNPVQGHLCIFGTPDFMDIVAAPLLPDIYSWIDKKNAIAQFNHPGDDAVQFGKPYGFDNMKLSMNAVDNICLIETANWNVGNNNGRYFDWYVMALDNGWRISPAGNQDNHMLNYLSTYRTAIIADELTQEGIFDAIKARRTYSTDDPDMRVVFKAGDTWMGSDYATNENTVELIVMVNDDEPITDIQIITNTGYVVAAQPFMNGEKSVIFKTVVPCAEGDYFFARITGSDTNNDEELAKSGLKSQVAVTAPIWIKSLN